MSKLYDLTDYDKHFALMPGAGLWLVAACLMRPLIALVLPFSRDRVPAPPASTDSG